MAAVHCSGWRSYHIFYHADSDLVLWELVMPLLRDFWATGVIQSFFFVRYRLGGPHLRLRLLVTPHCATEVASRLSVAAASFFARYPSKVSQDTEVIRRVNRAILARDSNETDDRVYPDNSVQEAPFRPEVERYGGPELLEDSLELFTLSSVAALLLLAEHRNHSRGRLLAEALRLLVRIGWSFASDADEAMNILDAFIVSRELPSLLVPADRSYERHGEAFRRLVRSEIEQLSNCASQLKEEAQGCRYLSAQTRGHNATTRLQIGCSHAHMMANRIGLTNAEEVYLGRIQERAIADLRAADPEGWERLCLALIEQSREKQRPGCLRRLARVTVRDFLAVIA
jgi:thiopeptide-type bacteriocin biosynthesis protein